MATYTGKDGAVLIGTNAIGELRDWSLEVTANTVDSTVMSKDWTESKITQRAWTGSANVYYDPAEGIDITDGTTVTLKLYPQGATGGLQYYQGAAYITSVSSSASFDGMIEQSISFTGTGELQTLS